MVNGLVRVLKRHLSAKPSATAIVTTCPRQAATTLSWLSKPGVRVPEHVSPITLASDLFLDFLIPRVTGYLVNQETTAKLETRRLEWLTTGGQGGNANPWIVPEFDKGASVAEPSKTA